MNQPLVGLVGPCTSGKSAVGDLLAERGYAVRHIAQEHSFVPAMWRLIARPDVLIYLAVSYPETLRRRRWDWTTAEYEEQLRRLANAREHADLFIDTDPLTPEQAADRIVRFLGVEKDLTDNARE